MRYLAMITAVAITSIGTNANAQFNVPLRIKNAGVILTPTRYFINYPAGGGIVCVDNAPTASSQCTVNGVPAASFPLLAPDGTAAAPSYAFASNPATGMFETAAGQLDFNSSIANGTTPAYRFDTTNTFSSNYIYEFRNGGGKLITFWNSGGTNTLLTFYRPDTSATIGGFAVNDNAGELSVFGAGFNGFTAETGGTTLGSNSRPWGIIYTSASLNVGAASSTKVLISATAPTISSGFGTGASVTANNGTAAFRIGVGTTSATTGVIGLPTATTGWNCFCDDITTNSTAISNCKQTASATTTATIGNFSDLAVGTAWADNDVLVVSCFAF